jgi:tetratricopeptide (TPR) repeat protein
VYPLLLLPNGRYLAAASLGFRVMLADTIYLWSIQYYGHRRTPEGRIYLQQIYNTISDLDPLFIESYTTGALWMVSDMGDPLMALELLDRGIERNPDNWLLPWEAGWYSYMSLEDYVSAERYFAMASEHADAPPWVARLRAHMRTEQGDLRTAILMWEEILEEAEAQGDETSAGIAEQRIPDLYSRYAIGEIEGAIERFEAAQGRSPDSLALLVRLGMLDDIFADDEGRPINYGGDPFIYDPSTGTITDPASGRGRTSR